MKKYRVTFFGGICLIFQLFSAQNDFFSSDVPAESDVRTSLAPVLRMRCGPGPPRVELAAAEASEAAVPGEDRDRGHGLDRDGVVQGEDGLTYNSQGHSHSF